jgi:hypothetical protein
VCGDLRDDRRRCTVILSENGAGAARQEPSSTPQRNNGFSHPAITGIDVFRVESVRLTGMRSIAVVSGRATGMGQTRAERARSGLLGTDARPLIDGAGSGRTRRSSSLVGPSGRRSSPRRDTSGVRGAACRSHAVVLCARALAAAERQNETVKQTVKIRIRPPSEARPVNVLRMPACHKAGGTANVYRCLTPVQLRAPQPAESTPARTRRRFLCGHRTACEREAESCNVGTWVIPRRDYFPIPRRVVR